MTSEFVALCLTAVFVGAVHTAAGPDHSIPFVAMSRAGGWSAAKTFWVTVACGLGHVAGSAVLGFVGLSVGGMILGIESWDSLRGDIAAWMLIAFGLAYLAWGLHRATRSDATAHAHDHSHVVLLQEHADAWTHGHALGRASRWCRFGWCRRHGAGRGRWPRSWPLSRWQRW